MTSTHFGEADCEADWREPMRRIIVDWGLRNPASSTSTNVHFYAATVAKQAVTAGYLEQAYRLDREFGPDAALVAPEAVAGPRR